MFITFVDYSDASTRALREIGKVAEKYNPFIGFMWADNDKYQEKRKALGILHDEVPAMAFNMQDQRILPYPLKGKMLRDELMTWFDDVHKGKIQAQPMTQRREANDTLLAELLNNTTPVERDNWTECTHQEGFDSYLFLYTSAAELQH